MPTLPRSPSGKPIPPPPQPCQHDWERTGIVQQITQGGRPKSLEWEQCSACGKQEFRVEPDPE